MRIDRNPFFQFQGFQLFTANAEDDGWLARLWTRMDIHHRDRTDPAFWTTHEPGIESYLLRDRDDWLFFCRLDRKNLMIRDKGSQRMEAAVEMHVQFAPIAGAPFAAADFERPFTRREVDAMKQIEQMRVIAGLVRGLEWLEKALSGGGASVLCFRSDNPKLSRFSQKRLGFAVDGAMLLKRLIPYTEAQKKQG